MITKAYISQVISSTSVVVRMPLFHKISGVSGSVRDNELPTASICLPPNLTIEPKVGDVVIVAFEEYDKGKPVVIGYLSMESTSSSNLNGIFDNLKAIGEIEFGKDIKIGDISYKNIYTLDGLEDNIKYKFKKLDEIDITLKETTTKNTADIGTLNTQVVNLNTGLTSLQSRVATNESSISNIKQNYLNKNEIILGESSYGNKIPQNLKPGQIYFLSLEEYEKGV